MMHSGEKGSLTIEASVALTMFLIVIMAFLSIGRFFRTQNQVKHSLNQTAIAMSLDNRSRKLLSEDSLIRSITDLFTTVDGYTGNSASVNWKNELNAPYTSIWKEIEDQTLSYKQTVPNVIGTDISSAYTQLHAKGFSVKISYKDTDDAALEGTIAKQEPKAGEELFVGDSVEVDVYRYNSSYKFTPPDPEGARYVKNQALNIFTYYLCGEKITNNNSTAASEKLLKKYRIKEISFSETKIVGNMLKLKVNYKIDNGLDVHALFGFMEPEFTDYVVISLQ